RANRCRGSAAGWRNEMITLFVIMANNKRPVEVFTTRELADEICRAYQHATSRAGDYRVVEVTGALS
ncbi:MAG TPA: hypothetical protein VFH85_07960, partial [Gammaproteobacteria bacterium]|nr:hypothetical protein [Gammaproteobacteria bacterium]